MPKQLGCRVVLVTLLLLAVVVNYWVLHSRIILVNGTHSHTDSSGDPQHNYYLNLYRPPHPRTHFSLLKNTSSNRPLLKHHVELENLPRWIQEYVAWHKEMRAKYPGRALLEDPSAPRILVRTCSLQCGGLNDRIGKLPWDIYLANQTRSVYLIHWCTPASLQSFLLPAIVDWTIPLELSNWYHPKKCFHRVKALVDLFKGYPSARPTKTFYDSQLDEALDRAKNGQFQHVKLFRQQILGRDDVLQERLYALNETDSIDWTPSFGILFWLFFKPTEELQRLVDREFYSVGVSPHQFTAVHCRVRHPKAHSYATSKQVQILSKLPDASPDKNGLAWIGDSRRFAVSVANHAIRCAHTVLHHPAEPIYFYSDSEDLVVYIAHQLTDPEFVRSNSSVVAADPIDTSALELVNRTNIRARRIVYENLHIDRQQSDVLSAYYPSFVDLFIAAQARCVIAGVGNYAIFAAKLSGTKCILLHQTETWGDEAYKTKFVHQCNVINSSGGRSG